MLGLLFRSSTAAGQAAQWPKANSPVSIFSLFRSLWFDCMTNGYESTYCQGYTNLQSTLNCLHRTETNHAFSSRCQALRCMHMQKTYSQVLQLCQNWQQAGARSDSCQGPLQSVICYKRPSFGLHNSSLQGTTMQRSSCFQTLHT